MKKPTQLKIETVPINRLVEFKDNPRKHGPDVDGIVRSIEKFGWTNPILVQKGTNRVIAGHGRLGAAKASGLKEVPVIYLTLNDQDATAYTIADNKLAENSGWDILKLDGLISELKDADYDVSLMGYNDKELNALAREADALGEPVVEDEVPPPPKNPITKHGDLWLMGDHRLLCGDSTNDDDVSRLMDVEKADCVFTSPPYGVGVDYGKTYDDTIESLRKMLPKLAKMWNDVVSPGGYAVVNFCDIVSAKKITESNEPCEYPMALEYWPVFRLAGWVLWSRRIWCKPSAGTGSMQCISSNRASTNWEHIWTWKCPGKPIHSEQTVGEFPSQNGWFDSTHGHQLEVKLKEHGAGMPVCVAEYGVATHSIVGGIVHEPFCGTGTTMIACDKLSRKCYGMEISPAYCDIIVARWENLTGKKAERQVAVAA